MNFSHLKSFQTFLNMIFLLWIPRMCICDTMICLVSLNSVDATKETDRLGRLINHSKTGNCQTKLHPIDGTPHLILVASKDIAADEELLYDYGDRSKDSILAHPWLKC